MSRWSGIGLIGVKKHSFARREMRENENENALKSCGDSHTYYTGFNIMTYLTNTHVKS